MEDITATNTEENLSSAAQMSEDSPDKESKQLKNTNTNSEDESLPSNRFELELEFIQCLASPAYLHHLATTGLLSDPSFLAFLQYLTYWKTPEYVRFIAYPHALHFLDLILTNERFRREIANVPFRNFVHEQQYYAWQHRSKQLYGAGLQDQQQSNDDSNPQQNPSSSNQDHEMQDATSKNDMSQ